MQPGRILTGIAITLASLLTSGCGDGTSAQNTDSAENRKARQEQQAKDLKASVLSYIAQPRFSNADFLAQISGTDAELEVLNTSEWMVYFKIDPRRFTEDLTSRLSEAPERVEFARTRDGKEFSGPVTHLGSYMFRMPDRYVFRFPVDDFKVDASTAITLPFNSATYTVTMGELQAFIKNESIHGGYRHVQSRIDRLGRPRIMANHGIYVAKPGEPSLTRLVNSLTSETAPTEVRAQDILDFVTRDISYSYSDANAGLEILKRPNEVLMTGGSDCSGKAILLASLYEQAGIDCRFVYTPPTETKRGHISVAVEGNYGNRNGLSFTHEGKTFSIAEPTSRGFDIGDTVLSGKTRITLVQDMGPDSRIYNHQTGKPLPFR